MAGQTGGTGGGQRLGAILGTLRLLTARDTPWRAKLALAAAVIYLIVPFDLVPDWLIIPGILDDFVVVSALIWLARRLADPPEKKDDSDRDDSDGKIK